MATINVEIISDFVCAWCYIGKRKLEKAIALYQKTYPGGKEDVFNLTWRPYYLNYSPSAEESIDKAELMAIRLVDMDTGQREALVNRMNRIGMSVGISFRSEGKIGRTGYAHRLVHISQRTSADLCGDLVENLFQAYHELAVDISSKEALQDIAVRSGVGQCDIEKWLASDSEQIEVDQAAEKSRKLVEESGVPTYIIQGLHHIEGAQDVSDFLEVFIKVKEAQDAREK